MQNLSEFKMAAAGQQKMRKRSKPRGSREEEVFVASRKSLASAVKALDVYSNSKVATEFCVTTSEASKKLSLAGYCVMAMLVLAETWTYLTVEDRDHLKVDTSLGQRLNITLNVTFPALTCDEVHLDAMDVAGDYHPYMEHHIRKQRLTRDGEWVSHDVLIERANTVRDDEPAGHDSGGCGSCYGAESPRIKCCNSCDDLMRAYAAKGWSTGSVRTSAPQCVSAAVRVAAGEGCNMAGWFDVNKVGGNFHIALGESTVRDGRFIHQFNPGDAPKFNVTHIINDLRFGDAYPGMASPLRGVQKSCPEVTGLFQYFIKLVPTSYKPRPNGPAVETTRYSFTQRFRPLKIDNQPDPSASSSEDKHHAHPGSPLASSGSKNHDDHHKHAKAHAPTALLPGVFFVYDVSAFMVEVTRHRIPFSHFLVRVCAVIGGCSTLIAAIARIIGV